MSSPDKSPATQSIRNYSVAAVVTISALLVGLGGWGEMANLSGAVIGAGTVVVEGNVKRIQHREGGIVGEILVRNGMRVRAGELLVRLDDTITRANLAIVTKQIDQLNARRMRLVGERDDVTDLAIPTEFNGRTANPDITEYLDAERALFSARKQTIDGQKGQLRQRIGQIGQETEGLVVRRDAKKEELSWISEELLRVRSLSDKGLTLFGKLAELQRLKAQLDGERGQLISEIARAATRVTETELQILQLDQDRRAEILTELRDIDNKLAELEEQAIAAKDELRRVDIIAPQAGIVHELAVHTIGGVIAPGETIMQIVPLNETLVVEARIQPADIDQIHTGQNAVLRFSAFNQRTTPEIHGEVRTVAADLIINPQTNESWYTTRIYISPDQLSRLGDLALLAGMPVEVFIQTGERTAMSYLVKPLADQLVRAMRED